MWGNAAKVKVVRVRSKSNYAKRGVKIGYRLVCSKVRNVTIQLERKHFGLRSL